jgi:NAD(P)-dependent dehydrogenase (short-subunit alcohol dehydrogenase family)
MAISLVEKGYKVWASMRDLEGKNRTKAEELKGEIQNQSGTLEVLELDVTKMQSVQKAIDHIRAADGKLEVIVNNAGAGSMALLEDFTEEMLKNLFEINVNGVFRVRSRLFTYFHLLQCFKMGIGSPRPKLAI